MLTRVLADLVMVLHVAFVLFAIFGGFVVLKWKQCAWIHVPAVLWAALIEFQGWVCPLTPLENWLRETGGGSGYESSFIEHYLLPVLYPSWLTRPIQIALGVLVFTFNLVVYGWGFRRMAKSLNCH